MKKALCIVLCLVMSLSLFGCGMSFKKEVNLREKLDSLMATDEELGIKGKYEKFEDIKDGKVDKDLAGTWKTADGKTTYVYNDDGTAKVTMEDYGDNETTFTCITSGDYKVLCEGAEMESTDVDGNTTKTPVVTYYTYEADKDVLYMSVVEDTTDENMDSAQYVLVMLYRADEDGSIEKAMSKNTVSLDSFTGKWKSETAELTIADGTLKAGKKTYDISIDNNGQLIVEDGESKSAYSVTVSIRKQYDGEDKTKSTKITSFGMYYSNENENEKPNLIDILEDWSDFQPNYYTGTFDLQE